MTYSAEMEVFALRNILHFLLDCGLKISVLVRDRSTTVRAMLAEEFSSINHQFDIWKAYTQNRIVKSYKCFFSRHFIKGIKNRILKASKRVTCRILKEWLAGIVNMLWWSLKTAKGWSNMKIQVLRPNICVIFY